MKGGPLNILVLGKENVGKTALIVRFLTGRFLTEYASEQEMVYERTTQIGDKQVSLRITDIGGKHLRQVSKAFNRLAPNDSGAGKSRRDYLKAWQNPPRGRREKLIGHLASEDDKKYLDKKATSKDSLQKVDGVCVVYSVTDSKSYDIAKSIIDWLTKDRSSPFPMILLGNKADLDHCRKVANLSMKDTIWDDQSYMAFECSASADPDSVYSAFNALIRKIIERREFLNKAQRKLSQAPLTSPGLIRAHLRRRFSVFTRDRTSTM